MFKLVNILKYGYVVHKDLNLVQTYMKVGTL